MDKKSERSVIGVCIVLIVFGMIFSAYAGTQIGSDIGEFVYNITH